MADPERLYHIPFQREEVERPLRGRANPAAPRVQARDDRPAHGHKIYSETDQAVRDIEAARDQLLSSEHRLIDPGTAAICISVGSIARREDPYDSGGTSMPRLTISPRKAPSVFTRTGFGVAKAIKPDLVAYGGDYALQQIP
jgi:hypothetical protein